LTRLYQESTRRTTFSNLKAREITIVTITILSKHSMSLMPMKKLIIILKLRCPRIFRLLNLQGHLTGRKKKHLSKYLLTLTLTRRLSRLVTSCRR
jgi:hypothetical protein